jgi:excisionase family DNA binding protein
MPRLRPEDFYTTKELADCLKLTPRSVQRWIDAGQLPAYRFGRKYRVRGEDFDIFLDTYKAHQPAPQPRDVTDTATDTSSQSLSLPIPLPIQRLRRSQHASASVRPNP